MTNDRRINKRVPLTLSIAEPIRLEISSEDVNIPGIMVNLSASGMALILFSRLAKGSRISFNLDFMGVEQAVTGTVVRVEDKAGETFIVGIQFDSALKELEETLEKMSEDHDICELRYLMKGDDACFPDCSFRPICARRIKKDF